MANDLISGLALLLGITFCIIIYLIISNILKFIVSFRFVSKLMKDLKKTRKKYLESKKYKNWTPWKYE